MKRILCWFGSAAKRILCWFGFHEDKPDTMGGGYDFDKAYTVIWSWKCVRCGRVRWYER